MALSIANLTVGSDTTDDADFVTDSISPSANKPIYLSFAARADAAQPVVSSISGCGLTWEEVNHRDYDASGSRRSVFTYRALGASPTSGPVTVTFTGTVTAKVWVVDEVTGADISGTNGSGSVVQSVTGAGSGVTSLSITLAAFANAANAAYGVFSGAGDDTFTAGSGFTITEQTHPGANEISIAAEFKASNDTSVDITMSPLDDIGGIAIEIKAAPTIALTGTATASITEADIVTGGKTIILTLTNDTWVTAGATFDAQRQNIIDGLDSAQSEATGWNNEVRDNQGVGGVVRTSNTVVTITLDAQASYNITATETITAIIPATALTEGVAIVASPTFNITHTAASAPTVTTSAATSVTGNSAVGNGNVTSDGGATVTERGFAYGTSANPTTAGNKVVVSGTTGAYTGDITGLLASTLYHYRAYATNSEGTSYGADTEFTTSAATVPTVSNGVASQITKNSVVVAGNVTSAGGSVILERGFVLSTSPTPTINDTKFLVGGGTGSFSLQITKLKARKTYYVRAFARNSYGVSYG